MLLRGCYINFALLRNGLSLKKSKCILLLTKSSIIPVWIVFTFIMKFGMKSFIQIPKLQRCNLYPLFRRRDYVPVLILNQSILVRGAPGAVSDGYPDSKVHGANMGPTWVLSAPRGPNVGPMNLAIRVCILCMNIGGNRIPMEISVECQAT